LSSNPKSLVGYTVRGIVYLDEFALHMNQEELF